MLWDKFIRNFQYINAICKVKILLLDEENYKKCCHETSKQTNKKKNKSKKKSVKLFHCVQLFNPSSDLWVVGFTSAFLRDSGDSDFAADIAKFV